VSWNQSSTYPFGTLAAVPGVQTPSTYTTPMTTHLNASFVGNQLF